MRYQKVQGFRVYEDWQYQTNIATDRIIRTQYADLVKGLIVPKAGFCFEPSGPTIATKSIMRGVCLHDVGYWLIRNGYLEPYWKEHFDDLMHEVHLKDNVWQFRADYFHRGVKTFGDSSVDPANRAKVMTAP